MGKAALSSLQRWRVTRAGWACRGWDWLLARLRPRAGASAVAAGVLGRSLLTSAAGGSYPARQAACSAVQPGGMGAHASGLLQPCMLRDQVRGQRRAALFAGNMACVAGSSACLCMWTGRLQGSCGAFQAFSR